MPKIRVLDEGLINKIAAGEVIERPASVVKELIENSIDAHAKRILIDVKEGGTSFMMVSDDGTGMEREDVLLAIQRHATSKIKSSDDLQKIMSLGFRGEALASIAAVSRLSLKSNAGSAEGTEIEVSAGRITSKKNVVMPRGTRVTVKDLFFNVPARKKHLKSIQTEFRMIADVVTRYALINPGIYFELLHNSKTIINSPDTTDTVNNIAGIYGRNTAKNLLAVNHSTGDIEVMGSISRPGFQRSDRSQQSIYINGRYVRNKLISDAVYEGYHTMLNINKHPVYILDIRVRPQMVDVNVHPQKSRVRLDKEDDIHTAVLGAVKKTLAAAAKTPEAESIHIKKKELDLRLDNGNFRLRQDRQVFLEKKDTDKKKTKSIPEFRILGQILKTYAIVATDDGMLVVDQHAAQERVNYERFMKQYMEQGVKEQELLEPIIIETSPAERIIIGQNREFLHKLGFGVEEFGKDSFLLRKVPVIFERLQNRDIFLGIVDELRKEKTTKLDKAKEERIIRKACRASIKANQALETTELADVISDLFRAEHPYTCPHGRPTMIRFSADELEKLFRRKGL